MDAYIEVVKTDGSQERYPIEGAQITVGKSGTAGVSIPTATELELEHLLVAPRGKEGVWVSTSQGALTPTKYKGKAFNSGMVPWGAEFQIGSLKIRVTNKKAGEKKEGGISPVVAIGGIGIVGACVFMLMQETSSTVPPPPAEDAPVLFEGVGDSACPANTQARDLEYEAHSRGDRYRYNLRDGVQAVRLYDQARACYTGQSDGAAKAAEMAEEAEQLKAHIEADYAARRLRLHHATEVEDWQRVVLETTALLQLTEHLTTEGDEMHPYADYLERARRIAQAQADRETEARTDE